MFELATAIFLLCTGMVIIVAALGVTRSMILLKCDNSDKLGIVVMWALVVCYWCWIITYVRVDVTFV